MAIEPEDNREEQEQYENIMPVDAPFEDGFNMKTLWATLFVGLVMLPGAIYLGLGHRTEHGGRVRMGDHHPSPGNRQTVLRAAEDAGGPGNLLGGGWIAGGGGATGQRGAGVRGAIRRINLGIKT